MNCNGQSWQFWLSIKGATIAGLESEKRTSRKITDYYSLWRGDEARAS